MAEDIHGYGTVSDGWFIFDDSVTAGHIDTLIYRVGEKAGQEDTLWGGHAMAFFCKKTIITTDLELNDIIIGPELSAETPVRVKVKNIKVQPVSNIQVGIDYKDTTFTETYTGTLSPGDSIEYLFSHKLDCTEEGIFEVKSEIKTHDDNMINNTRVEQVNIVKITYIAGTNGTINGTNPQTTLYGGEANSVEAIPNTGYHFTAWNDGITDNPRTDTNITENITVTANFAINTYTLTYTEGENGSVIGTSPQTVEHGSDGASVGAIPGLNYHFVNWSDGSTDNPRADVNVTGDISVMANFAINTNTLAYLADENGTISGTNPQTIDHGSDGTSIDAIPNTGYHFSTWSDGSTDNPRTEVNVTEDIIVKANFAVNTYTLTYLADENGTVNGITPQTIDHGSDGTSIEAIPNTGYHFTTWSDGSTDNPRTDVNVTEDIIVKASFAVNTYTLTYLADENGTVNGITPQTVNYGEDGTSVEAIPNTGHRFVNWSDGSTDNPRLHDNVTSDITVTAYFELISSLSDMEKASLVRIYPVPASLVLNVEVQDKTMNTLLLVNNSGQTLLTRKGDISGVIDVSGFSNGTYYIILKGKNHEIKRKIVIY
jgi:hypothetical protein